MMDLDNFKTISEQYELAIGDKVIFSFSKITKSIARESGIISRFGGEEFACLLLDTNA